MTAKNGHLRELVEHLLQTSIEKLSAQERRVIEKIARRHVVARDVSADYDETLTFGQRVADRVAEIGGSWGFIIGFAVVIVGWVALNAAFLGLRPFDPYPYIFLNLMLSMLAAVQAPVIMMSQNRQAAKDRLTATHDYEVNLKAEVEIVALHEKLDRLREEDMAKVLVRIEDLLKTLEERSRPA